jgi:hypothetical protein
VPTLPFWVSSATLVALGLMMQAPGPTTMPPIAVQVPAGKAAKPWVSAIWGWMSVALR